MSSAILDNTALETLLLPLQSGLIAWPPSARALFLRARTGMALREFPPARAMACEQSFRPFADALQRDGYAVNVASIAAQDETFPLVLMLPTRQRDESRALLARAVLRAQEGGVVVASMANNAGARSGQSDLAQLLGPLQSLSKNHCRVFWAIVHADALDHALLNAWVALDAPRPIGDGRFSSRPGLFAWDRIDTASALLASALPDDFAGHGADLGAGYGYLSAEVLARCPRVTALDLYEAEARALELAQLNLAKANLAHEDHHRHVALEYFWHDVTTGLSRHYDFIVSNPPFHQGRADQPELGRAFINAAADALLPGGRLWLVANRHLPYESALAEKFVGVRSVIVRDGFKVLEAVKGK